jgi:hypothetical protein
MVKQVSFSSKKSPRIVEGRKSRRARASAPGKIVCEGNASAFNCTIHDLSASGASIRLPESRVLSKRFHLIDMQSRFIYEAEVVWVAYSQRGLRFVQSYDSHTKLPPHLESVKRQCFERGI